MRSKFKWIFTLLLALTMQFSFAQERTITGVVSDAAGTLPGANVVVKGTNTGVQTDIDGKYSIQAKTGDVLIFTFVGMTDKSVTVGASNTVNVVMEAGVKLTELVLEGYRTTTKTKTVVAQTTVSSKTIENRPNASFVQTLQGQVAGLSVQTGTGQPGAKSTVIIRGLGTLSGRSDPLYVIDGIPTTGDNFRSLNPEDIESATVLKDAASLAIYGNRGAAGVIVIKTKRGKFEDAKMSIRYSVSTGITQLQRANYAFANAKELLTLENRHNTGLGGQLTLGEIAAWQTNTDWVNYFFRDASTVNHQLSIENSGRNLNSYTSVGYTQQDGILRNTGLKRFSLRNNLTGKSANERFQYDTSIGISFSKSNEATSLGTGGINQNYVLGATLGAPYVDPSEYQNSQQLLELYQNSGTLLYTPLFLIDKLATYRNRTDETRTLVSADVSYEAYKGFTMRSKTAVDVVMNKFTQYQHPISFNSFIFQDPSGNEQYVGFESFNDRRDFRFSQLWQASYEKTFAEKHTLQVFGNLEYNFSQVNTNNFTQNGLDPEVWVPETGVGYISDITTNPDGTPNDFYVPTVSATKYRYNLISYFGSLDYDFDSRYGIVGSFRYDGTSVFTGDRQWGTFWSVGARWNIDNENFLKDSKFIDVLKLRVSYGTVGNQYVIDGTEFASVVTPLYRDTYSLADAVYNNGSGIIFDLGWPDLHWEVTTETNIGLDFEFMKSRLKGNIDLYNKRTTDLLNTDAISPITGQPDIQRNSQTEINNRGAEVSLSYDLIRKDDLKLTIRGNWAYNENTVDHVYRGSETNGNIITQDGGLSYEFYLIPYAGVNPENGNLLFLDINNNLTENPNPDTDRRAMGINDNPVYQGAFGFDFDYKGFFATTNFTYTGRSYRIDFDLSGLYDPAQLGQFTVSKELLNAWTPTNTHTDIPSLDATNIDLAVNDSDRFLKDASYVRLRYAQVGYRVPKQFLEKTFMSGLTFYVQGENIYTWSKWQGFDAESNRASDQAQYPTPRIWTFGMDLRF